ncbi:MAG: sialidase family protein [Humidesulfovibrio sp.]|uniref:sialidase family protein n=1 Tax=Humidesulfovibrio sp. TaxID=2910988 RepID=UPI0027FC67C2|nr:sialidase family protein [Humidesulfovibrio sp.]MDQ7833837.1 sialidase family protein [Humidesulfovibrio sp.]
MPSLDSLADRHVVIDRRQGHYLCFPDLCLTDDGRLLCVYNEFDRHVGTRRKLMLKESADLGRTWGEARILCCTESHCPRITKLSGGLLIIVDDAGPLLYFSADQGRTWAQQPGAGLGHGLQDRMVELGGQMLLTTGHMHRGSQPQPRIRQAPSEQMSYLSRNQGRSWEPFSVIAYEKCLVLCEASVILLPQELVGGPPRLLALMRENSFVGEPMYYCISEDGGASWGQPRPTPLIGHRPTLGWTSGGNLLVTYRDVGPDPGTKAWLGSLDDLCSDFEVHGLHPVAGNPRLTKKGLVVKNEAGQPSAQSSPVRYSLRPLTDPASARAVFEAEVKVVSADVNGCGIRLGLWWKLYPDCLAPDVDDALPIPWTPGRFHTVRIEYEPGLCRLFVDGHARGEYPVDRMSGETRPILVGAIVRKGDNACEAVWRRMSLATEEPSLGRHYAWSWDHQSGLLPDEHINRRVLELKNDRQASPADFGYSGWVELPDGRFYAVYHHGGGLEPGYTPGESSHVVGTIFSESDFGVSE